MSQYKYDIIVIHEYEVQPSTSVNNYHNII